MDFRALVNMFTPKPHGNPMVILHTCGLRQIGIDGNGRLLGERKVRLADGPSPVGDQHPAWSDKLLEDLKMQRWIAYLPGEGRPTTRVTWTDRVGWYSTTIITGPAQHQNLLGICTTNGIGAYNPFHFKLEEKCQIHPSTRFISTIYLGLPEHGVCRCRMPHYIK